MRPWPNFTDVLIRQEDFVTTMNDNTKMTPPELFVRYGEVPPLPRTPELSGAIRQFNKEVYWLAHNREEFLKLSFDQRSEIIESLARRRTMIGLYASTSEEVRKWAVYNTIAYARTSRDMSEDVGYAYYTQYVKKQGQYDSATQSSHASAGQQRETEDSSKVIADEGQKPDTKDAEQAKKLRKRNYRKK